VWGVTETDFVVLTLNEQQESSGRSGQGGPKADRQEASSGARVRLEAKEEARSERCAQDQEAS
jgi:hypothetical protein